ncbi:DUF2442 domain-containing protein [Pseudohongiella spirulinae]|uniref:DUF2442 domain-containing protein n=1 Tax=Pseudohongiella spirulinae TaxID=1249552 RepID=A0A0S2KDQ5_9GAMM|nr:DUF2442 domain-containing protein [Pseudohongiella spirulinae]ALO46429.1 hypothetical protein PS2015_1779 [Pseudohongiella spirulinae]
MHPAVTKVKVIEDHKLRVSFENGEQGELDMTPYLDFGVFSRLKNPQIFNQVTISFKTIEWPCGVDLDPEFVYEKTVKR